MIRPVLGVVLLLCSVTALAQAPAPVIPTVTLPATIQANPGRLTLIHATSTGKVIKWVCLDPAVDLLPYLDNAAIFSTAAPGSYRVLAYTALGDQPSEPAICTVVVGGPVPVPPGPVPPGPAPVPNDPLYSALLPAWQAEADPQRVAQKTQLAALYRQAVATAGQAQLQTVGDLFGVLVQARQQLMDATALVRLRTAIGGQVTTLLPTNPAAPLDAGTRATAAQVFGRIAQVLEVLP